MDDYIQFTSSLKSNQMNYHDIDYDDEAEGVSETTHQSAREELEYIGQSFFRNKKMRNLKNGCSTEILFQTHLYMPIGYSQMKKKNLQFIEKFDKAILLVSILVSPLFVKEI